MSWGTCNPPCPNNIHFNFPGIINDGSLFTSYQPAGVYNEILKKQLNVKTNEEYRKYLQQNGNDIIEYNKNYCFNYNGYTNLANPKQINNKTPYIFKNQLSNNAPYGYESSDLKNIYLSKEQLNQKKIRYLNSYSYKN